MASKYIGANRGTDLSPDAFTVGTSSGSTDMEFRADLTKSLNTEDCVLFLQGVIRRLEDGRLGPADLANI